jgi:hypothetical protein
MVTFEVEIMMFLLFYRLDYECCPDASQGDEDLAAHGAALLDVLHWRVKSTIASFSRHG